MSTGHVLFFFLTCYVPLRRPVALPSEHYYLHNGFAQTLNIRPLKLGIMLTLLAWKQVISQCNGIKTCDLFCFFVFFFPGSKKNQYCIQRKSFQSCVFFPGHTVFAVSGQINGGRCFFFVFFFLMGERSAVLTAVSWQGPINSGRRSREAEERS